MKCFGGEKANEKYQYVLKKYVHMVMSEDWLAATGVGVSTNKQEDETTQQTATRDGMDGIRSRNEIVMSWTREEGAVVVENAWQECVGRLTNCRSHRNAKSLPPDYVRQQGRKQLGSVSLFQRGTCDAPCASEVPFRPWLPTPKQLFVRATRQSAAAPCPPWGDSPDTTASWKERFGRPSEHVSAPG